VDRRKPCLENLLQRNNKVWRILLKSTIAGFLILGGTAQAQSIPDDPLLDSLIATALAGNPDLQAAVERAGSAEHMVTPAGALPDPMATVGLSGPITGSWVEEPMAMPNVNIGLSQKFPFPGKQGASKNAAASRASGLGESVEAMRQMLAARVKSSYYDLAYWLDAEKTVQKNLDLVGELEAVAIERYRVGKGLQVHALQAQKTLTRLEDKKLAIEQMIETSRWSLARLLGRATSIELAASLPDIDSLPTADAGELEARLLENNPDYRKSDFDISMKKYVLKKAKLDYLPDLTLGVGYGFRWENEMFPMFSNDMLMVTAGLNIPLWAGWKQKNIVSSARADLRSAEYMKSDLTNRLTFELQKNLLEYDRNRARYALYRQALIPQTDATMKSARAAYQVGELEFLDVITAQMELFNAELELQRSLADALKALAEIERLTAIAAPDLSN
jgi:cobalt-zinc-cadmium efflux system outer membrane protein